MFLLAVTSPDSLYYYFCNVALLQPVIYEPRTLVSTKVVLRRALYIMHLVAGRTGLC